MIENIIILSIIKCEYITKGDKRILIKIVLASESPRRKELLERIGLKFQVLPSSINEYFDNTLNVHDTAIDLSFQKAYDVAKIVDNKDAIVVGADTLVVYDGKYLGKPKDVNNAFETLKMLQGNWHEVITGFSIINNKTSEVIKDYEETRVKMISLDDLTIKKYIMTKEPMDKAGSYGIQGKGSILIERIEGCYYNVMGLPLPKVARIFMKFGIELF